MNKFIEEQLNNCNVAKVVFTSEDTHIVVPKYNPLLDIAFIKNHCYIIELEDHILKPNENSLLVTNWNGGIIPKSKFLKCCISVINGNMIKVDGCGYDIETNTDKSDVYQGLWLPKNDIKLLKEL